MQMIVMIDCCFILHIFYSNLSFPSRYMYARWKGAGRYVARYNQCRLDNFSRVRVLRAIFFPWKACHVIAMKVRGALRRKTEQLIR